MRFVTVIAAAYYFGVGAPFAQLNPPIRVGEPPSLMPAAVDVQTAPITPTPTPAPAPNAEQAAYSSSKTLYLFDLNRCLLRHPENKTWQYDVINLVSALQGLVNRQEPQLYILYVHERLSSFQMNVDEFWLRQLRGSNGFLSEYRLEEIETLEELLEQFRTQFASIVLWDPGLPATGNVALTIAGIENLLPLRYDKSPGSLYNQIVAGGPQLNAQVQLSGKFSGAGYIPDTNEGAPTTKTAKTDAYMWAKLKYLDAGACSPSHLAYFLDPYDWEPREEGFQYPDLQQCMIVNHDFYVSQKSFFLDLDPWFDETATDSSPNPFHKGIDQFMLFTILQTALEKAPGSDRILRIGGFVPWWIKYSNQYIYGGGRSGLHSPAATAEEFISHISKYGGVIDADSSPIASMANASVFQHAPLKERYNQNPVPPARPLENKNYLLFAIGDFRSSALLYQTIPTLWHDSLRGEMPIAWAISPILSERTPHIFDYLYETRTRNDYFISGAPGAGLCHVNRLLPADRAQGLGDRIAFWQKLSLQLYEKFDLHASLAADLSREARTTYFPETLQSAFLPFSPHGVGSIKPFETPLVEGFLPFIQEQGNFIEKMPPLDAAIQRIVKNSRKGRPAFHLYRFNLANPTTLFMLYQRLLQEHSDLNYQAVDPFTFFYLLRQHLADNDPAVNYLLPAFLSTSSIPRQMKARGYYPSDITLRNDGWDEWKSPDAQPNQAHRLTYRWFYEGQQIPGTGWHDAYVKDPVYPGEQTTLNLNILAPDQSGLYRLNLIFGQENVRESSIREEIRVYVGD
ncbi:MAG: hypothetical protein JXR73_13150 [Candidatus Omnitrophica bacterium]|nr:hypothetical protein [Candidatus Omnitrophota bacterium]